MSRRHGLFKLAGIIGLPALIFIVNAAQATANDHFGATYQYHLSVNRQLNEIKVRLCFAAPLDNTFLRASSELRSRVRYFEFFSGDSVIAKVPTTELARVFSNHSADCLRYRLLIAPAPSKNRRASLFLHNGALVADLDQVLVQTESLGAVESVRLDFELPDGFAVSAPGRRHPDHATFDFLDRPFRWQGKLVVGVISQRTIVAGTPQLRMSIVGKTDSRTSAMLGEWISAGVQTIETAYGRFPVNDVQILVFPLPYNDDPVPWGEVTRGGGDAVHMYVDATRTLETLNGNWVLAHELSHLIHPYLDAKGAWLSEGIASYYQNVLRARAGHISAKVAWQKLHAGFERGRQQVQSQENLARDTRAMMRRGQYMRVYWGGAAIALIGDVALRRQSQGALTLNQLFGEIASCCLPVKRRWAALELMQKLDELAGYPIFVDLYEKYAMSPAFPDLGPTFEWLGISTMGKSVYRANEPHWRARRRDIMGSD